MQFPISAVVIPSTFTLRIFQLCLFNYYCLTQQSRKSSRKYLVSSPFTFSFYFYSNNGLSFHALCHLYTCFSNDVLENPIFVNYYLPPPNTVFGIVMQIILAVAQTDLRQSSEQNRISSLLKCVG